MGIEFYYIEMSPFCRSVMLCAKALGVELDMKNVNLQAKEHMTPEYLKMNPQHTVPTINDNGFFLHESRAIMMYLCDTYSGEAYYPKDPKQRAIINQRLFFDIDNLMPRVRAIIEVVTENQLKEIPENKMDKLKEAFKWLDGYIGDNKYTAGNTMTIADFALVATVSGIEAMGFNISPYPRVSNWLSRCKTEMIDYDKINANGAAALGAFIKKRIGEYGAKF